MLEFRLFGPLEVRDGERVLDVRRRKPRALLAALALRAGELVTTDRLVDDLWGEQAPRTARHALENYVSELRKALGRDVIATRSNGYLLDVDTEQVDVLRFERLLAEAGAGSGTEERANTLREALALFRAPVLADLAFEPFAQTAIARFDELELTAREDLVEVELELGRHAGVVAILEPVVAAHPYRERARAQLMLALYRSGRQADALAVYQDGRRILVEELGIDPGDELQELERSILRQDPSLRAPPRVPVRVTEPSEPAAPRRPARKTVTILFAELANAAFLADRLDPERLRAVLDRYVDGARVAVERHGGTCGRLTGDTISAIFGVPAAHEDDAVRAVRAAVEMREGVGVLNDGLLPEHGVFLEVQIALNTGEVLVTPDGEELVTGRAVTVAEQLERAARPGQIVLGAATYDLVRDVVDAEELSDGQEGRPDGYRLVELLPDVYGRALRLDSTLVGRRRQLTSLSSAFENAVTDRALHLFTVLGTAGVGKSRLVREFVESVEDVATVLQGRCLPYGEAITYWPLYELLRDAGLGEPELGDEPAKSALSLFARLAGDRPLVVVLDDLQWAEPPFLDVVDRVVESSRDAAILLVCVARPELIDDRPTWGGGKLNASSVLLEPLGEAESERLVDNLLGESDLAEPVRDYIVRTAEGNPLFVEELLTTLVERDVLRREAGRWTTTEVPAIPLPPTIQALVSARIDRLPDGERRVLELAAAEGKVFHLDTVLELAPAELRESVESHLGGLLRKELVRPRTADGDSFTFRHELIRDAAYASMPMQVRAELHEHLAAFLERGGRSLVDVEELAAYHRSQAQRYRAALGPVDESARPV